MELHFETGALLLLIAAVVAMLTRRFRLPYSVGLVAAGIILATLPIAPTVNLTKDFIFTVLLPPLLFEAALYLDWKQMRRDFAVISLLATLGVVLSAGVTAGGMHYLIRWEWQGALVFGALIAATDPVSVIATFKEAKAHGRLLVLIEAESLLNDGTAAVLFGVMVALASGRQFTSLDITAMILKTIGGGILCGAGVALGALLLAGRTDDHLVEITFTTVAAYGSFLLADHFGLSGVLATITAGLIMGNFKPLNAISERGKEAVQAFWEYAAFIANSLVFLLIGMREARQEFAAIWLPAMIAIALVTLGRAVAIYPCCLLFSRSSLHVTWKHQHILFWGGLRGALALALALGLPPEVAQREKIITISFAVVAFSVFVQGLTMTPFLRRMGEIPR
ncbi:MAG TPA: sodium:proton antiporter [Bryobacteraceae bacterium]|jgi:CPA1 family monovalent cation:H+ antiporter|nr:sodium:proton antiporter [Bryobacteraceae bacterium]